MTVAHAQRPGRKHQQRRHRKDPAHGGDRELVAIDAGLAQRNELAVAQEAGGEQPDDRPREEDPEGGRRARRRDEEGEDRAGEPAGLFALAGGQEPGVDRDERRGEGLFPEQVLQQIR